MTELDVNQTNVYDYLCEKLNSKGLEIEDLVRIGKLSIGQQSVAGMIAMNQRLGYILEREGRLFTAGSVMVRLTLPEQESLEQKAKEADIKPEELLGEIVISALIS